MIMIARSFGKVFSALSNGNFRRKAAKPNKAKPSRETVEPPSGAGGGTPNDLILSVKFWFGNPVPHDHM